MKGEYVAPPPLLVIPDAQGTYTVIDGAGILAAHSHEALRAADPDATLPDRTVLSAPPPDHPAVIFDDWNKAHRTRLRIHYLNRTHWGWHVTALDLRRIMSEGLSLEEASAYYSPSHDLRHHHARLLTALNTLDAVNQAAPTPYTSHRHFTALAKALSHANIADHLNLPQTPGVHQLPPESSDAALVLMTLIAGHPGPSHPSQGRLATNDHQLAQLNDIYGHPASLQDLINHPQAGIAQVHRRLRHRYTTAAELSAVLASLQETATAQLADIKLSRPDLIPFPNEIHVANCTYTLNSDRSHQYTVHLAAANPQAHAPAAEALREALEQSGFPHLHVSAA